MESNPALGSEHRKNCFDIMRHSAAYLVMVSHHFALNGFSEPKIFGSTKLGTLAVIIFFSISGYLIASSFINSKNSLSYFKKRVLRIFPGLIICSLIMTVFIFPFFGEINTPSEWFMSLTSLKSFLFFSLFGSPGSGELVNGFSNSYIFYNSANGSLWSLKFEFLDYIAIMVLFGFIKKPLIASIIFITLSFSILFINSKLHFSNHHLNLLSDYYIHRAAAYSIPFSIGAFLFTTKKWWVNDKRIRITAVIFSIITLLAYSDSSEISLVVLTIIPILIIIIGTSFHDTIIKGRFDISYGVYIYAFPIQQIFSNYIPNQFFASLAISTFCTTIIAIASWFFVEKRFLKRSKKSMIVMSSVSNK